MTLKTTPPAGYVPIPNSKKGGYHKPKPGGGYYEWYPVQETHSVFDRSKKKKDSSDRHEGAHLVRLPPEVMDHVHAYAHENVRDWGHAYLRDAIGKDGLHIKDADQAASIGNALGEARRSLHSGNVKEVRPHYLAAEEAVQHFHDEWLKQPHDYTNGQGWKHEATTPLHRAVHAITTGKKPETADVLASAHEILKTKTSMLTDHSHPQWRAMEQGKSPAQTWQMHHNVHEALRHHLKLATDELSKGGKPPAGYRPIKDSRAGGYVKEAGGYRSYWYPPGTSRDIHAEMREHAHRAVSQARVAQRTAKWADDTKGATAKRHAAATAELQNSSNEHLRELHAHRVEADRHWEQLSAKGRGGQRLQNHVPLVEAIGRIHEDAGTAHVTGDTVAARRTVVPYSRGPNDPDGHLVLEDASPQDLLTVAAQTGVRHPDRAQDLQRLLSPEGTQSTDAVQQAAAQVVDRRERLHGAGKVHRTPAVQG